MITRMGISTTTIHAPFKNLVAPMTSSSKTYPTRVEIIHDNKKGWIVLDQIRTVDRQRIVKLLGNLTDKETKKVKEILRETYVD